jgi:hypothetical protein
MAKKKKQDLVTVQFEGTDFIMNEVIYKQVDLESGGKHFMHLEKKGNRWLLLHTTGMLFDTLPDQYHMSYMHPKSTKEKPMINAFDRDIIISRYTCITLFNGNPFYHLDELDDDTWRITHATKFFKGDHKDITWFRIWDESADIPTVEVPGVVEPVCGPSRIGQQLLADRNADKVTFDDTI